MRYPVTPGQTLGDAASHAVRKRSVVQGDVHAQCGEPAIAVGAQLQLDRHRRGRRGGLQVGRSIEHQLHRPVQVQGRGRGQRIDHASLAAEAAAHGHGHDADRGRRQLQDRGEPGAHVELALTAGIDGHSSSEVRSAHSVTGRIRGRHRRGRLQVALVHERRAARALHNASRGLQRRLGVATDILTVCRRRPALRRGRHADDRRQRLVVHLDERCTVRGGCRRLADHQGDRLPREGDHLARQHHLLPDRRRVGGHRQIGGGEHGHHARGGARRLGMHGAQPGMCLGAQDRVGVQHAGELHVGGVAGCSDRLRAAVDQRPWTAQVAVGCAHLEGSTVNGASPRERAHRYAAARSFFHSGWRSAISSSVSHANRSCSSPSATRPDRYSHR